MANLSVIISAVDNLSNALKSMSSEANSVLGSFGNIEQEADSAFETIQNGADESGQVMNNFASMISEGIEGAFRNIADEAGLTEEQIQATLGELPNLFHDIADGIENGFDDVQDEAKETGDEVKQLGDDFENAGNKGKKSGEKMEDAMSSLDKLLATAGIVMALREIASAFSECIAMAETAESAYAKLETIAGSGPMSGLKGEIQELSNETGIAVSNLADVTYNAISAGTAVEESVEMAASATKLATAGFTDTASALSVLTTATNAYGDAAGTATQISDSLITVQNLGVTTVADLSANMGKAIATASAYNFSLDNLESSYISITKAGINTAEGTTYISSMLKELGSEGSNVSKVLQEETGQSFAELMASGNSLADVLGVLYDACEQDATALMNLWGSAEAGKASNAIISQGLNEFNNNLVALQESAGATSKAYETMADTTEFAHQKMLNNMDNMKISIGNSLNPMMEKIYDWAGNIFDWIGKISDKLPWLTGLIAGVATGVGILTVAVVGYTVAKKIATAAEAAHTAMLANETTAMAAQLGIYGAIAAAVVVATVAISSYYSKEEEMTASTIEMQDQLAATTEEYNKTCEALGETSDEAVTLKAEMDALNEEIENNGMTLEQFYNKLNEVCDAHDDIVNSFRSVQEEADKNQQITDNLVAKLRELSESADDSTESQAEMEAIVKRLNLLYPELGISIDDVNGNLDDLCEKIEAVNGATRQAEYEAAQQTYTDLIAEQTELLAQQEEAYLNLMNAEKKYANQGVIAGTWNEVWGSGAVESLDDAQAAYERINAAVAENQALLDETSQIMEEYTDIVNGTSDAEISAADAVSIAIAQNQEAVSELAEEYQAAYDAALSSVQGQWELWEEADEVTKASIEDMNAALQSQIDYWNNYAANLESLHGRNIEGLDEMVVAMDDGSAESAAYLQAMSEASDDELSAMVENFNALQEAQQATADDMAELETNFEERLGEIESAFQDTVDNMNMEDEARTAAEATIQGYINGIKSMQDEAEAAASAVSSAVTAQLSSGNAGASVPGHAKGTLDSESFYLAGEEGPELIKSGGGDTVFPASETSKIINKIENSYDEGDSYSDNRVVTDESNRNANTYVLASSAGDEDSKASSKTITLDIKGSGSLSVERGADRDTIWESIQGNIKNAVMSILSEEIFEGSEGAYEF